MSKAMNYNWWQYARYVYNIGRTSRYKDYSDSEVEAIKTFLTAILEARPELTQRINLKNLNSLVERDEQNNYSLGLMVQTVGRCLKAYSLSEEEKTLCDTLFAATGDRKNRVILPYANITGIIDPPDSGSISGLGSYAEGTTVTLTAVPAEGYQFLKWEDDSTEATREITVSGDASFTATFEAI